MQKGGKNHNPLKCNDAAKKKTRSERGKKGKSGSTKGRRGKKKAGEFQRAFAKKKIWRRCSKGKHLLQEKGGKDHDKGLAGKIQSSVRKGGKKSRGGKRVLHRKRWKRDPSPVSEHAKKEKKGEKRNRGKREIQQGGRGGECIVEKKGFV